jgi:hypothetical protein
VDVVTDDRRVTIEGAISPYRERDVEGRILASPDWWDLAADDREALFEEQLASRRLERLADPQGLSGTVRAVLARIARR